MPDPSPSPPERDFRAELVAILNTEFYSGQSLCSDPFLIASVIENVMDDTDYGHKFAKLIADWNLSYD